VVCVTADLDTLLIALYVLADEFLPRRQRARRHPRIEDAELVCLAVAQIFLDCPSERRFLRLAMVRLSHLFPYLPKQPGYNKRMRALAPQIVRLLNLVAFSSPSWCDPIRLLDSTPVPCGASRETVKRSDFAGHAAYGYCPSHSRYFWGFRLSCCALRTACRSRSNSPQPTPPSAKSPPKCSRACNSTATP
jgi:hypothetical protein